MNMENFEKILRDCGFYQFGSVDPMDIKFRDEIRKMCEAANLTVKRLSRISIGNLKLNSLPVGKWRHLTQDEIQYLYTATKLKNQ